MAGKTIILVVDAGNDFYDFLIQTLEQESNYEVIGLVTDGKKALHMIKLLKPDIVIIDLILPEIDGIGVIEEVNNLCPDDKPTFLVKPSFTSKYVEEVAVLLGVFCFILKLIDPADLLTLLRQTIVRKSGYNEVSRNFVPDNTQTLEKVVATMLLELGVSPHIKGYQYLREAIIQATRNTEILTSMTKLLYPQIAKRYLTSSSVVEGAIRYLILMLWSKSDKNILNKFFIGTSLNITDRPTNSRFIAAFADKVRIATHITEPTTTMSVQLSIVCMLLFSILL